jgi:hypothetical protein
MTTKSSECKRQNVEKHQPLLGETKFCCIMNFYFEKFRDVEKSQPFCNTSEEIRKITVSLRSSS